MTTREIIAGLKCCSGCGCDNCPYAKSDNCIGDLFSDAEKAIDKYEIALRMMLTMLVDTLIDMQGTKNNMPTSVCKFNDDCEMTNNDG